MAYGIKTNYFLNGTSIFCSSYDNKIRYKIVHFSNPTLCPNPLIEVQPYLQVKSLSKANEVKFTNERNEFAEMNEEKVDYPLVHLMSSYSAVI